jgi:broad specificity phosphatase PhoE
VRLGVTRLVLCRHAEAGNREQSATLASELSDVPLSALYTSPLDRACETALAIAARQGLMPVVVPDLREIEQGDLTSLQFDDYPEPFKAELLGAPATVRFPGGETHEELRNRVAAALAEIVARHPHETVAAVSHAGAIRAALATWLDTDVNGAFRIDQSFAAVNVIDWTDGEPFVRLVNGSRVER